MTDEQIRTGGHAADDPDPDAARDAAQQAVARARYLVDVREVIAHGDSLP